MRPIFLPEPSVNQTLPSGPAVMAAGLLLAVGIPNAEKLPLGVMRPMAFPLNSVNHRLPSDPAVMPSGPQPAEDPHFVGKENWVMLPDVVMRPIWFEFISVNHRLPSGPTAMLRGPNAGPGNSVTWPLGVIRPPCPPKFRADQRLPS